MATSFLQSGGALTIQFRIYAMREKQVEFNTYGCYICYSQSLELVNP